MFKLEERNPSAASAGRVHTPTPTEYQDKACPNRDVPRFTHISIRARKHLSSAGEDDSMGRCAIKPIRHARKTDQMKGSKMKDDRVTQWDVGGSSNFLGELHCPARPAIAGVQGRALSAGLFCRDWRAPVWRSETVGIGSDMLGLAASRASCKCRHATPRRVPVQGRICGPERQRFACTVTYIQSYSSCTLS